MVVQESIDGTASGLGSLPADVHLPPQYFDHPDEKFPVIYLYHGIPDVAPPGTPDYGGPASVHLGDVRRRRAGRGTAGTSGCPRGAGGVAADSGHRMRGRRRGQVADVPQRGCPGLGGQAATAADRPGEHRNGGYSMGGFAPRWALRNPDKVSVGEHEWLQPAHAAQERRPGLLFGNVANLEALVATYNSIHIVETSPASHSVTVWMDIGSSDDPALLAAQQQFADTARAAGMYVVTNQVSGGVHGFDTWAQAFSDWIPWAAEILHRPEGARSTSGSRGKPTAEHEYESAYRGPTEGG